MSLSPWIHANYVITLVLNSASLLLLVRAMGYRVLATKQNHLDVIVSSQQMVAVTDVVIILTEMFASGRDMAVTDAILRGGKGHDGLERF
jgi:hypothetical protein